MTNQTGATDFIIRTEDLRPEDALELFVATARDNELLSLLKTPAPLVLEGSRGTGKSFLFRVCEQQQLQSFTQDRVLPVYISFLKSSLLNSLSPQQFLHWMLTRLCSHILRAVRKQGLNLRSSQVIRVLSGGEPASEGLDALPTRLEMIVESFENSYRTSPPTIDETGVPTIEEFRDAIQDLCEELTIRRFNLLFDEAAHIFRPEQQRQFFTLFRDLRSPYMTCNAAVYPGVTAYGDVFETMHDARIEPLNRDLMSHDYLTHMREIVMKQARPEKQRFIERNGKNFDALAYAVTGNPRLLLKTVALAGRMRSSEVTDILKDFYRNDIWAEHSTMSDRYLGHKELIDWGREFVERTVIPEAKKKNDAWQAEGKSLRSAIIWLHRDVPEAVKEAIRLLTYTGIVTKIDDGARGTRSRIGTRYLINIGCLVASAAHPIARISDLRKGNTIKRFTEFGANYQGFAALAEKVGNFANAEISLNLRKLLRKPIMVLDLSEHQKHALGLINITTIDEALTATEETFQQAPYIGSVRSRKIMNVVTAAALQYLSG